MNGSNSPVDAIAPAVEHARRMLFRPFDPGRWIVLGFLTFLCVLGYPSPQYQFGVKDWAHDWWSEAHGLEGSMGWMERHTGFVLFFVFFAALALLVICVVLLWLSSRAVFCYLDSVARGRAEVVRPWKENGDLADSFFFWRLVFTLAFITIIALLLAPVLISVWGLVRSGEAPSVGSFLFGTGLVLVFMPIMAVQIAAMVLRTLMIDFVAPIQYVRRVRCSEALKILGSLIRAHIGAFVIYFLLRIVFAVLIGIALFLLGCFTCCIGFCIAAIPVIGQAVLQPVHVFTRSFPLFFLRGYGIDFDVFASGVLGGAAPPPPGGPGPGPAGSNPGPADSAAFSPGP